ncbi:MAG: hypothetical protein HN350_22060 [Phycisphaerales bacterium]|jgi:hypothetical protein|nr:hypothetical protein [Phycisphaerales bacterium]
MAFDPTMRILLDEDTSNLNRQISQRLAGIDEAAAVMKKVDSRKEEGAGRNVEVELGPEIAQLTADVDAARMATISAIDNDLETRRENWTAARDRNPTKEVAEIRRAENRIKGMDDKSVADLAGAYADDTAGLNVPELNEISARLRQANMGPENEILHLAIDQKHGHSPWIAGDPEAAGMANYRKVLSELRTGEVSVGNDEFRPKIRELADLHGDLNKV